MTKVHQYLLKAKSADKEKRKDIEVMANPFGKQEERRPVEKTLRYAENEKPKRSCTHKT